jgi:hypothetical protein
MLMRSTTTPGTVRSSAQGSRELGIFASSSCVKLVEVPTFLVSMIGDAAVTVTASSSVATFIVKGRLTDWPTVTAMSLRTTLPKPASEVVMV